MKLAVIIILAACMQVNAKSNAQTISLSVKNMPMEIVLKDISKQSGYDFVFTTDVLQKAHLVSIDLEKASLKDALDKCFSSQPLTFSIIDKTIIVKALQSENIQMQQSAALPISVHGMVKDENGQPLSGVSVTEKGGSRGTFTNINGAYFLEGVDENSTLVFSMIGYNSHSVVLKNRTEINITLTLNIAKQEEVVVITGYQKIPKERATGSFDLIKGKQIENKIQTNVLERLEGLVPGLLLINGKDNGSTDGITIRGVSTLYGTRRPLLVVDGFPIEGDINTINPQDVASISVLKDAAAASIWGARAANGVIVITTKNLRKGKINFTYNNSFQFSPKPNLAKLHRLSSSEDVDIERKLLNPSFYNSAISYDNYFNPMDELYFDSLNHKITPQQYAEAINKLGSLDNTQQIKDILMQVPFTQSNSLSFNGGDDKNQYYGSIRHIDNNGYALKDKNESFNSMFKGNFKINNKLSFGVNTNFSVSNGTGSPVNPVDVYRYKPYQLILDASGNPLSISTTGDSKNQNTSNVYSIQRRINWGLGDETYSPLKALNTEDVNNRGSQQRIQAELNYDFIPGISLNISYQFENGNLINKDYLHSNNYVVTKLVNDFVTPTKDVNGNILTNADGTLKTPVFNIPQGGIIKEQRSDFSAYSFRAQINLNKIINTKHEIAAVIGGEQRKSKSSSTSTTRYGYDDNTLQSVNIDAKSLKNISNTLQMVPNGFLDPGTQYSYKEDRYISSFANASYTFNKKYVLSGSARLDATNLFGTDPKYRYRPLWSSGASWVASNEPFLSNSNVISYLQLRATYGLNGNIPKLTGPFMIATTNVNSFTGLPSNTITTPANTQLRWERTAVTNLGIDYSLFKDRITGKVDWYLRKSSDLMGNQLINPTYGFSNVLLNTGDMNNRGLEIQLTTKNVFSKNFSWSTTFMYAVNKNKIINVGTSDADNTPYKRATSSPYVVGYPYGALWSFKFAGLTKDNGQIQLYDGNGRIAPDIYFTDVNSVAYSGNINPQKNGAFSNEIHYKNFDFSFMFVFYGDYFKRRSMPGASLGSVNALNDAISGAWQKPGDEEHTTIPNIIPDYNNHYYASVYFANYLDVNVFNASYIKLREAILTYTLPQQVLFRLKFIRSLQLNFQGRNLWTLVKNKYGYDPEAFSGEPLVPVSPTYAFGLNLNF